MKPVVLLAQAKDLQTYIKSVDELNLESLLKINKRLMKMLTEVSENLEKFQ